MKRASRWALPGIVTCAVLALVPASAAPTVRRATATYFGTTAFSAGTGCTIFGSGDPEIGGACFPIEEGETQVTASLDDVSPLPAGGDIYFLDTGGAFMDNGSLALFCDTIANKAIPEGAGTVVISADSASGPISCLGSGGLSAAGTIAVDFLTP